MRTRLNHIVPFFCLMLLSVFLTADLAAQSGGYAGSFSRMGFSPRGMAMGNAMSAVESEGIYGYYNPASAAAPSESIQLDVSTAALRFDRQLHMVNSHFSLPPTAGLSVSLINARTGNIDGRSQSGYHTEYFSTNEFQLTGNFAIRFSDRFWGGIGLKYNFANLHDEIPNSSSIGIDAGLRFRIKPRIALAVTVQDLLAEQNLNTSGLYGNDSGDNSQSFPTRFVSGAAFDVSQKWLLSLDFEIRFYSAEARSLTIEEINGFDSVRTVRIDHRSESSHFRLGTRYVLHERITFRGGLQYLKNDTGEFIFQPSAGFSLHLPYDRFSPSIDYAFVREPSQQSNMHVFAIRLNI